jgi:uridylate kinase
MSDSPIVISVGGSLVAPSSGIDYEFLKNFKRFITSFAKRGWRFVIVVGGGVTARQYQEAARKVGSLTRDDLDWLGIHATRLNGHLMRTIFRAIAHPVMLKDPSRPLSRWKESVLVAAGWKPGWSTDYVATRLAKRLKADTVINLSNIDFVYDKDPRKFSDARPIREMLWKDFRVMVGNKWDPGMNAPFDPVASRLAQSVGMRIVILNGKKIKNLEKMLDGKKFIGTVIH